MPPVIYFVMDAGVDIFVVREGYSDIYREYRALSLSPPTATFLVKESILPPAFEIPVIFLLHL